MSDAGNLQVMTTMTKKRRILAFKLDEISAVDRPAQEHALAVIMKRADAETEQELLDFEKHNSAQQDRTMNQPTSFRQAVWALERDGHSGTEALHLAACRFPDLLKAYNSEGIEKAARAMPTASMPQHRGGSLPLTPAPERRRAIDEFHAIVNALAASGLSKTAALRRARVEHPREFEAYQNT